MIALTSLSVKYGCVGDPKLLPVDVHLIDEKFAVVATLVDVLYGIYKVHGMRVIHAQFVVVDLLSDHTHEVVDDQQLLVHAVLLQFVALFGIVLGKVLVQPHLTHSMFVDPDRAHAQIEESETPE